MGTAINNIRTEKKLNQVEQENRDEMILSTDGDILFVATTDPKRLNIRGSYVDDKGQLEYNGFVEFNDKKVSLLALGTLYNNIKFLERTSEDTEENKPYRKLFDKVSIIESNVISNTRNLTLRREGDMLVDDLNDGRNIQRILEMSNKLEAFKKTVYELFTDSYDEALKDPKNQTKATYLKNSAIALKKISDDGLLSVQKDDFNKMNYWAKKEILAENYKEETRIKKADEAR